MEEQNSQLLDSDAINDSKLSISQTSVGYLEETGKWARFLAILGFVYIGFIVLIGIFWGTFASLLPGSAAGNLGGGMSLLVSVFYLLAGLLYFMPAFYLFKFAQKILFAVRTGNNAELDEAFSKHKSFYKFFGILAIILLSIYVMILLAAIVVGIVS